MSQLANESFIFLFIRVRFLVGSFSIIKNTFTWYGVLQNRTTCMRYQMDSSGRR